MITLGAGLLGAFLCWLAVVVTTLSLSEAPAIVARPLLEPSALLLIFGTLVGTGLVSGVLPALRASRIDPAISLRAT